ncbi:partial Ribosomal RNA small subunit methyltransferase G, partial [Burkholderiales bacterium]
GPSQGGADQGPERAKPANRVHPLPAGGGRGEGPPASLAAALDSGLADLGLALAAEQRQALLDYLALLHKWNRVYNLTAVREPERMLTLHLLDSLAVLPALGDLPDAAQVLDIGSGGGLPGIPLAIARPTWRVTLLDASQKKASFLRQVSAELKLQTEVLAERAESVAHQARFDLVISRAFADLNDFLPLAWPLLRPGGWAAAMKGVHPDEEIARLAPEISRRMNIRALRVPGLEAQRHLLLFTTSP